MIKPNQFTTKIKIKSRKNYADLGLFKTPSNLPFLWYRNVGKYEVNIGNETIKSSKISLEFGIKPIAEQPSLDDLWPIALWPIEQNENIQRAHKHELGRIFAANILCSSIARRSRRACGNILIVPNETERMWFSEKYARFNYNIKVFVDYSLEPNELRATYWRMSLNSMGTPVAVDGGIQISPDGVSYIQQDKDTISDYRSYFARGFM